MFNASNHLHTFFYIANITTKEVIIKSFDVCGITADNISKPKAEAEAEAEDEEEEHVNMDDVDDSMMDNIVID